MAGDANNNSQPPNTLSLVPPLQITNFTNSSLFLSSTCRTVIYISRLKEIFQGFIRVRVGMMERKTGLVRAAISSKEGQILEGNSNMKFQSNYREKLHAKTREFHQAKRDTNQFYESRRRAESEAGEAKSELSAAKKTVKELTSSIEESNSRAKEQKWDLEKLKMSKRKEGEWESGDTQCVNVMKELEEIKRELSKLKMDMASVLEEKRRAEKEIDDSQSKTQSYLGSVERLNKDIEEINEEHVLVELARIEAVREYEEIEAQRRQNTEKYSTTIEETHRKKENMIQEIEDAEEMETRLAITTSDINVLESELKQVKEMDKVRERNEIQEEDESCFVSMLESVMKELEATKKELATVKDESFQFMASMDVVRGELTHVANETARLKKKEEKSDMTIQNLNSKLLRAKAKLEATCAAEDKAKLMVSNLSQTLEQIKSEADTIKKEWSVISEETAVIKAEVQRTETEIDLAEERLQAALQDLEAVKSSEAVALENLKALIEKTVRNRASASRPSPTIIISKFEYEYLTGHAAGAKEIADKKVEAAQAWIEALKASEKEIQIKTELLRRETRELKVEEEREVHKTEESMNTTKMVGDEFKYWRERMEPENLKPETARLSKAMNRRRGKARRSASPLVHGTPRSTSFTVRRRTKVMPNLTKFFSGKSSERNP
ncbi:hypothetical protein CDL12_27582 [Handroanthus impetiginosus]|uniref:Uncharacterized protein n=1 Tax=Handroanthus impetiginosus TaxID=429701 RepID=A0A2G9G3M4_9LAMI|nr:hypothetical protein CDL12_27582 [Handroanthus impetiginosus]